MSYEKLRKDAQLRAEGAMWGERVEAAHLAEVAIGVVAPLYEGALEARDEQIRVLLDTVEDLEARLARVRAAAA